MERAEPNFEKVRDGAVEDTIGDVAGGAAKKKREASSSEAAAAMAGYKEPGENGDHDKRASDKNDSSPGRSGIREEAESHARIAGPDQIDEMVDHFMPPAFIGLRFEPGFGGAIEEHNGKREPERAEARR